jgi:hypothetical protein
MQRKYLYSLLGLFVGAFVNVLFNLIAAAIQQRAIGEKFNDQAIWWIAIFSVFGLLIGYWLSIRTETSDGNPNKGGIRARGITSHRGKFTADERTGQGIDAENIRTRGDVSLRSSKSLTREESASGSIDAKSLNAGGNIAIFSGSVPSPEQLEFFRSQLNLPSTHSNHYFKAKFQSYWDIWRKLQLLRLAGDDLWNEVNEDNILAFTERLREISGKVEESAIFFDEEDYVALKNILQDFASFRLGKIRLWKIRSQEDFRFVFMDDAVDQIEHNRDCKSRYETLLNKIRVSFRGRLCG